MVVNLPSIGCSCIPDVVDHSVVLGTHRLEEKCMYPYSRFQTYSKSSKNVHVQQFNAEYFYFSCMYVATRIDTQHVKL